VAGDADGIVIPITASGGDQAAREIAKPTAALGSFSTQAKASSAAALNLGQATQKLGPLLNIVSSELGQLGGTTGKVVSAFDGLMMALGGAVTIKSAVVTGGAIFAVGLLAKEMAGMIRESQIAAKVLDEQTAASDRLAAASRNVALAKATNNERVFLLKQNALASEAEVDRLNSADDAAIRAAGLAAIAKREDMETAAGARGFGGRGGRSGRPREWTSAQQGMFDAAMSEGTGGRGPGLDMRSRNDLMSAASASDVDAYTKSLGGMKTAVVGGERNQLAVDRSVKQAKEVKAAWTDAATSMTDGFAGAFSALVTGGADAAAAVLAGLGDQMVAEGSRAVFSGLFQTALGNPMGPTMLAIGGAEIAFGAGLGATMQGATGGGGGSGAARPSPGQSSNDNGNGRDRGPTVINMYALNPTAETGRSIAKGLRMNERKSNKR
jgi:hypothetical protein